MEREAAALAQLPNVRLFASEREARESWVKHLGVPASVCRGGDWLPGGRRIRKG